MSLKTKIKIGIDEAGRGPWAWPVVAAALAFDGNNMPESDFLKSLNDSKKLSEKKRAELYEKIIQFSGEGKLYFWVGTVDNYYIDEKGIKQANKEAMRRAIVEILRKIPKHFDLISAVVDGNDNYEFEQLPQKPLYLIGWDAKVGEISWASIIAKVFRDKLMHQYASLYPEYHFEKNAAYGTKKHKQELKNRSDITGIHRISYKPVKDILEKKSVSYIFVVDLMRLYHSWI